MNELQELFQLYPHVDFAKGIAACADSYEVYLDILQTYAENPVSDKLNAFYEQKDAYNYQVLVHSAKSASMNVGFTRLGEKALALENAARDADWDFIRGHHEAFLGEYLQAIDAIKKAFAAN